MSGQDERDYDSYLVNADKAAAGDDGGEANYDLDGLLKKDGEKSRIEPLPVIDHSKITYRAFQKNFYKECNQLSSMSEDELSTLREELEVSVTGSDIPKPIKSFKMSCLPPLLINEISKSGFENPTSIQAQALPIALSGRDIIGLAKTGSGNAILLVCA